MSPNRIFLVSLAAQDTYKYANFSHQTHKNVDLVQPALLTRVYLVGSKPSFSALRLCYIEIPYHKGFTKHSHSSPPPKSPKFHNQNTPFCACWWVCKHCFLVIAPSILLGKSRVDCIINLYESPINTKIQNNQSQTNALARFVLQYYKTQFLRKIQEYNIKSTYHKYYCNLMPKSIILNKKKY